MDCKCSRITLHIWSIRLREIMGYRESSKRWVKKQKEQGLCNQCNMPAEKGRSKCKAHLFKNREIGKKKYIEKLDKWKVKKNG